MWPPRRLQKQSSSRKSQPCDRGKPSNLNAYKINVSTVLDPHHRIDKRKSDIRCEIRSSAQSTGPSPKTLVIASQ